ncbi:MAG: hypothetical protein RJA77_123 [Pseudomonadota bacterium]
MSSLLPRIGWLVPNVKTNDHQELYDTEMASSRLRAGVCIQGCERNGMLVYPLNFREPSHDPHLVFMAKFVPDSNTGQFLDDSGTRAGIWLEKIQQIKAKGRILVVDYTDNHFTNPNIVGDFYRTIRPHIDAMVVPSTRMARHLEGSWTKPLEIIPEPVEVPMQAVRTYVGGEKTALWFGHNSNLPYLLDFMTTGLREAPPDRLIVQTNFVVPQAAEALKARLPKATQLEIQKWTLPAMLKAAAQSHYAIIPSDVNDERKNGASPGRLLTSLAMGLPVVATPLESYLPFAGYFAQIGSLEATELMRNPAVHADRIEPAQALIEAQYTVQAIGAQWAAYARRLMGA